MASKQAVDVRSQQTSPDVESHPRDVKNILNSLPVIKPTRNRENAEAKSLLDFVIQDTADTSPEEEGPFKRAFLTGMDWTAYLLAIGVVIFLTWAAGDGILRYLAHQ